MHDPLSTPQRRPDLITTIQLIVGGYIALCFGAIYLDFKIKDWKHKRKKTKEAKADKSD